MDSVRVDLQIQRIVNPIQNTIVQVYLCAKMLFKKLTYFMK